MTRSGRFSDRSAESAGVHYSCPLSVGRVRVKNLERVLVQQEKRSTKHEN